MCISNIANGLENPCTKFEDDIKLTRTANTDAIQRDLDSLPVIAKVGSSAELEQVPASHGRRSKALSPGGPPGHQVAMKQIQQATELGIVTGADFKSSL